MSWKDYLYFSKKERRGITVLLALILLVTIIPGVIEYFSPKPAPIDYSQKIKELKANATPVEKPNYNSKSSNYYKNKKPASTLDQNKQKIQSANKYSQDDKNEANLKNSTQKLSIQTNPKTKNTTYANNNDSKKSNNNIVEKNSVVDMNQESEFEPTNTIIEKQIKKPYQKFEKTRKDETIILNINTATAEEFKLLKGIGDKLSHRIITFRTKLGGFATINQVGDTFGIEPEIFNAFKHQLTVEPNSVTKLNFNTATAEQLSNHSYISPNLAKQIVNYREKVKPYQSFRDVEELYYFKNQPELYKKLKPYITF